MKKLEEVKHTGPQGLKDGTKFVYKGKAKKVFIESTFNNWNPTAKALKEEKPGERSVILPLTPGRYEYKFVVDGRWIHDPLNENKSPDGFGGFNSVVVVECEDPGKFVGIKKSAFREKLELIYTKIRIAC